MPSTTDYLRNKFMKDGDGIDTAEDIIIPHGGTVNIPSIGIITVPDTLTITNKQLYPEFWNAVQFLCEEWDYAIL